MQPEPAVDTFSGQTSSGCGQASSAMGPFYCPSDGTIYFDPTFFEEILQGQLNGPSGASSSRTSSPHEYGHHIQNLLGTMGKVKTQQGPNSDSVRLELQADCYAGMWARNATCTQDSQGNVLIQDLTDQDIQEAHRGGQVRRRRHDPADDHRPGQPGAVDARLVRGRGCTGSTSGYQNGTLAACNTFVGAQTRCTPTAVPLSRSAASSIWANWRCSARRYGATAGWRYLPASAPSPPATRASAHSARDSAV